MEATTPDTIYSSSLPLRELAIVTAVRMVQTTAYRIVIPLMPVLALSLGIERGLVTLLVTTQVLASLLSPLGGILSTRYGQRATMTSAMAIFSLGTGLCAFAHSFTGFLVGYALIGLASTLYHPSAQSYLSARTPYARRGFALGMYEISWAAAALLGVGPLMLLVDATQQPAIVFGILVTAGLLSTGLVRLLPLAQPTSTSQRERFRADTFLVPRVSGLLIALVLVMAGSDMIFVVQSLWLHTSFNADAALLGTISAIQGGAELIGSCSSALFVDRIGKKRSVFLGFGLMSGAALLLPSSNGSLLVFLPIFALFVLGFEFGVVSVFPLASGVAPLMRSVVLSLCTTAVGLGRAAGSIFAEPFWSNYGIGINAAVCAALTALGLLVCAVAVREGENTYHADKPVFEDC